MLISCAFHESGSHDSKEDVKQDTKEMVAKEKAAGKIAERDAKVSCLCISIMICV